MGNESSVAGEAHPLRSRVLKVVRERLLFFPHTMFDVVRHKIPDCFKNKSFNNLAVRVWLLPLFLSFNRFFSGWDARTCTTPFGRETTRDARFCD